MDSNNGRLIQQALSSMQARIQNVQNYQFRVPNAPRVRQRLNLPQQRQESIIVRSLNPVISSVSSSIQPRQANQSHVIRLGGVHPNSQHYGITRLNQVNLEYVNVSRQAYNQDNVETVFLSHTRQGVVVQRRTPQIQHPINSDQSFIIRSPQFHQNQQLQLRSMEQYNGMHLLRFPGSRIVAPATMQHPQSQDYRDHHSVQFNTLSSSSNVSSTNLMIVPANLPLQLEQPSQLHFPVGANSSPERGIIRSPQRFILLRQHQTQNVSRLGPTPHPALAQQRMNVPHQFRVPIVRPRNTGPATAVPGPSGVIMPRVIMLQPSRRPPAQQLQFHQLPGLNFNRAQEQESNDEINAAETVESETANADNVSTEADNSSTQTKKASGFTGGKKRKNQDNDTSNDAETSQNDNFLKRRRKKPATEVPDQSSNSETNETTGETGIQAEGEQNASNSDSAAQKTPITPAQRLLQVELKQASRSSIFQNGVRISIDKSRCHSLGVYVFNVLVLEKENCSDYPPVKLQITEDYPAEIPVFLDFQPIACSITNKRTRQRFELAVKFLKKKICHMQEIQFRIPMLIFFWSVALKQMIAVPQSRFNPKSQKKKEPPTNNSNFDMDGVVVSL